MTTVLVGMIAWGGLSFASRTAEILLMAAALTPAAAGLLWRQALVYKRQCLWERERRRELEAYCRLDVALPLEAISSKLTERAKRVCRLIATRSVFSRSALFLVNSQGKLTCVGSCGMDDLTLDSLDEWSERLRLEEKAKAGGEHPATNPPKSFPVVLSAREEPDGMPGQVCTAATLIPVRLHRGRLVGLLAVCAGGGVEQKPEQMQQNLAPLELLASKLARTIERALLMERLIELERLAGAGHLVAGVAEELNRPLNLVLDCSELIAGTASEARVREHGATIAAQAHAMKEVLGTLRGLWVPAPQVEQAVNER